MLIQIILLVFAFFALSRVVYRYKKGELTAKEFFAWSFVWFLLGVIAIVPDATSWFAHMLGVGRGSDLAMYFAVIMIFFILFKIFGRMHKIESDISKITEYIAIEKHSQKTLQASCEKEKSNNDN